MARWMIISNRLPLVIDRHDGAFSIRPGAGGLVTALRPLLAERGGAWIGFCGMYDTDRGSGWEEILAEYGEGIRYYAVTPPASTYDGYYLHYANQELWPRFHSLTHKMASQATRYWDDYVAVNRLFADRTENVANDEDLLWIQDYHLMLLPRMLRNRLPTARMGHFLHIPFPPLEILRDQPQAAELIGGVLAADLVGFHIPAYMDHFLDAAREFASVELRERNESRAVVEHQGRIVELGAFPIGIDPAEAAEADSAAALAQLGHTAPTRILSVDRLDYTKAIPPRLEAFGRLLDEDPQYRGQVSLIQLLDVSRSDIPAYQEELEKVERISAEIQQRYPEWPALYLTTERWDRPELAGLMRAAPICVVTPRVDGMNLVCKEYVAAAPDDGVLVLSRQAGAAWQLGEHAVLVDGNSPESILQGLRTALTMPPQERRRRMDRLKENVRTEDVFWWANRFVTALQRPKQEPGT